MTTAKQQRQRRSTSATHLSTAIWPDEPRGHQLTGLLWRLLHGCQPWGTARATKPPRRVRTVRHGARWVNTMRRVCYHIETGAGRRFRESK